MSKNCVVTKLIGSVDNNNLPVFGMLSITFATSASASVDNRFNLEFSSQAVVKSDVPFYLTSDMSGTSYNTYTYTANTSQMIYFQPNKSGILYIEKYKISKFDAGISIKLVSLESSEIKYCESLNKIFLNGTMQNALDYYVEDFSNFINIRVRPTNIKFSGNIKTISDNNANIVEFTAENAGAMSGDIKYLGDCLKMNLLTIKSAPNIYGTIKEMVERRCANAGYLASVGNTTITLNSTISATSVTFDGTTMYSTMAIAFSKTQVVCTSGGVTRGTYDVENHTWS